MESFKDQTTYNVHELRKFSFFLFLDSYFIMKTSVFVDMNFTIIFLILFKIYLLLYALGNKTTIYSPEITKNIRISLVYM